MSGGHREVAYLGDMVEACERILTFTKGARDDEVLDIDGTVRGAVLHQFVVLGEAAKHVPREIVEAHREIPWADMARLRDKIVHYYFGLDDRVLLAAVRESVPRDLPMLRALLHGLEEG